MTKICGADAIARIENEFPEIRAELHDEIWDGLLHLQTSVFSHLAQRAIDSGDNVKFKRICHVFVELFQNGEDALVNALNVSFLEHLNFEDGKKSRKWGL